MKKLLGVVFACISTIGTAQAVQLTFEGTVDGTFMNFSVYGPQTAFPSSGFDNREWAISDTSAWALLPTMFPSSYSINNSYGQLFFCAADACTPGGVSGVSRYHELISGYESGTGGLFSHEIDIRNLLGPMPIDNLLNVQDAFSYQEHSGGVSTGTVWKNGLLTLVALDYSVDPPFVVEPPTVPEPSTILLLVVASLGLVAARSSWKPNIN